MTTSKKIAGYPVWQWRVAGVVTSIVVVFIAYLFFTRDSVEMRSAKKTANSAESVVAAAKGSALWNCQRAIKSASRDPETAKIPNVPPMQGGADFRFLWNETTEMVRMRNGLGLEVATLALCVVDESSGKIKLLTLDGKQLIAPGM